MNSDHSLSVLIIHMQALPVGFPGKWTETLRWSVVWGLFIKERWGSMPARRRGGSRCGHRRMALRVSPEDSLCWPSRAPVLKQLFGLGLHWNEIAVSLYASGYGPPQEELTLVSVTPCSCSNSWNDWQQKAICWHLSQLHTPFLKAYLGGVPPCLSHNPVYFQ